MKISQKAVENAATYRMLTEASYRLGLTARIHKALPNIEGNKRLNIDQLDMFRVAAENYLQNPVPANRCALIACGYEVYDDDQTINTDELTATLFAINAYMELVQATALEQKLVNWFARKGIDASDYASLPLHAAIYDHRALVWSYINNVRHANQTPKKAEDLSHKIHRQQRKLSKLGIRITDANRLETILNTFAFNAQGAKKADKVTARQHRQAKRATASNQYRSNVRAESVVTEFIDFDRDNDYDRCSGRCDECASRTCACKVVSMDTLPLVEAALV